MFKGSTHGPQTSQNINRLRRQKEGGGAEGGRLGGDEVSGCLATGDDHLMQRVCATSLSFLIVGINTSPLWY